METAMLTRTLLSKSNLVLTFKRCSDITAYESTTFFNRFCIPTDTKLFSKVSTLFSKVSIETFLESLSETKNIILASVLIAFVLSFIFSYLLEKCAAVVVTISLVGFYIASGYLGFICFKSYKDLEGKEDHSDVKKYKFYKAVFFILCAFALVVTCMICCLWSRLVLAVKIIGVNF